MTRQSSWNDLGDVLAERPHLGPHTTVLFHRLLRCSIKDSLERVIGPEAADRLMREAGETAGNLVYERFLAEADGLNALVRALTDFLRANNVAILRMEEANEEEGLFVFTIMDNLDCPDTVFPGRVRRTFDEGLLASVLTRYCGRRVDVRAVECWGREQRICRYEARVESTAEVVAPETILHTTAAA